MLLSPEERGGWVTCFPAILRSCKQVNGEATDMLAMLFQDQKLVLRTTLYTPTDRPNVSYGVEVKLNGKVLGRAVAPLHCKASRH